MVAAATPPAPVSDNNDNDGGNDIHVVTPPPAPVKKQKTISIKSINTQSTWQLENADDVKKYITELEKKLINSLEEGTIINIEF